jgi:8-oxo-dGTP pyrophosphatase MutT (NUDIX family)
MVTIRRREGMSSRSFNRSASAPAPNRPPGLGVVALLERNGALLLDCRSDSGRWGLIGGAVEPDESLDAALRREVAEETGLAIRHYTLFGAFSDPSRIIQYSDDTIVRIIALAYRVPVEPGIVPRVSDEATALRFYSRAALRDLDIVETHRHIVEHRLANTTLVLD